MTSEAAVATRIDGVPETEPLTSAFVVKSAVYEKGMAAGLGLKATKPEGLRPELADPARREALTKLVCERIVQTLEQAGVRSGIDDEAISSCVEEFLSGLESPEPSVVTRRVAQGEPAEAGTGPRLQYPLNPDGRAMGNLLDVPPTSRRRWLKMVSEGDTLVELLPAEPGKPGSDVLGNEVEPPDHGEAASLHGVAGTHTVVQATRLVATCSGAMEESATGRVRVVPELVVENVDNETGPLPESGTGAAGIHVEGVVMSGFRVATSQDVVVGSCESEGSVEDGTPVQSRCLAVAGPIHGSSEGGSEGAAVEAQELCLAREIVSRRVAADRILVTGHVRFARLEADGRIRVDGDVVGGRLVSREGMDVAGDLGTKRGGSGTRITVPARGSTSRRMKTRGKALVRHQKKQEEIRAKIEQLEKTAERRGKSDRYWAALCNGEERTPRNGVEATINRQFADWSNIRKALERNLEAEKRGQQQLQAVEEAETEAEAGGTVIQVQGKVYLDVDFEGAVKIDESDMEAEVSYSIEDKRHRHHTLKDIRTVLGERATDFVQSQEANVQERKAALDQMFEEAENRPSGPEMEHRQFELPFEWSVAEDDEADSPNLHTSHVAYLDSSDPRVLLVRSTARMRETMEGVQLTVTQGGPRVQFGLSPIEDGLGRWQDDGELLEELEGIAVAGVSAREIVTGQKRVIEAETGSPDQPEAAESQSVASEANPSRE